LTERAKKIPTRHGETSKCLAGDVEKGVIKLAPENDEKPPKGGNEEGSNGAAGYPIVWLLVSRKRQSCAKGV
jgi:hypothetical protein